MTERTKEDVTLTVAEQTIELLLRQLDILEVVWTPQITHTLSIDPKDGKSG